MNVGDIDSCEMGTGARDNAGKIQWELVPVRFWLIRWDIELHDLGPLRGILVDLERFQTGEDHVLEHTLGAVSRDTFQLAIDVLTFGATKYKAWNWAKGMPWSVCIGCIGRHAQSIVEAGREDALDPESGLPHMGHILANVIFLAWYADNYRAGDDRPPRGEK